MMMMMTTTTTTMNKLPHNSNWEYSWTLASIQADSNGYRFKINNNNNKRAEPVRKK